MATTTTAKKTAAKKTTKKAASPRTMSDDHKAKLAQGRNEARVVSRYLEAVAAGKGKRGRKRTPESISMHITRLAREIEVASPLRKLELTQKRFDLESERERLKARVDLAGVERDFVKVAKSYAARTGITYGAFRELGVPADVLKRAGVSRARA
jgi:replicative DNA helicase